MLVGALLLATPLWAQDFSVRVYQPSAAMTEFTAALDTVTTPAGQVTVARDFQQK